MAWYMHKCTDVTLVYTLRNGDGNIVYVPDYYSAIKVIQETEDVYYYTIISNFTAKEDRDDNPGGHNPWRSRMHIRRA